MIWCHLSQGSGSLRISAEIRLDLFVFGISSGISEGEWYLCLVDSVGIPMWHLMWSETRCAVVGCDETDSKAWSHKNVWDETIGIIFDVIIVIIIIIVIKVSMKTESIILLKSHLVSHHTVCLSADFAASSSIQELLHPYIYPVWFFEAEAILPSQCVWPYLAGQK